MADLRKFVILSAFVAVGLAIVAWKWPKTVPAIVAFKVITPF